MHNPISQMVRCYFVHFVDFGFLAKWLNGCGFTLHLGKTIHAYKILHRNRRRKE